MAQLGKGKLNYRCPSCFLRDLDIDMFYNKETGIYSCIRCQYRGTEEDVLEKNEMIRFRYKAMHQRFDKFDFDKATSSVEKAGCGRRKFIFFQTQPVLSIGRQPTARRSEAESNCHGEELYAATAGRKWSNYGEKEERYHRASVL